MKVDIWVIADTHFNHKQMKTICFRPDDFENKLRKGLEMIPEKDILIHLGDICLGNDANVHEEFIMPLKCRKWLIMGNHDRKGLNWYLNHGWDFVAEEMILTHYGKRILFTHAPRIYGDFFDLNIHGHQHNLKRDKIFIDYNKFLFAVEHTGYKPLKLKKIVEMNNKGYATFKKDLIKYKGNEANQHIDNLIFGEN